MTAKKRSRLHSGLPARLSELAQITAGALILAVNLNLFLAPADIAPGGVSGTAIILNELTGWPIGLTMLALNIPLVLLGYRHLGGRRFLGRTVYAVLIYNLGADLISHWVPAGGLTNDLLLNALFGGIVAGLGSGLIYRSGGTTAGTGILGRVLQIRTGIPVSQLYILTDGGVILVASLVFGWQRGLYALITLFVWGVATDYVLEGPSMIRVAFIITDQPEAVTQALFERLQIGVTAWPGHGMFTTEQHTVLFCAISRPSERELRAAVLAADPAAFFVVSHGHQASGGVFGPARRRD